MKFEFKPIALVALLAGTAFMTTAQAQQSDAAMPQQQQQQSAGPSSVAPGNDAAQPSRDRAGRRGDAADAGARMERRSERMQTRIAQRLAALKVKLKLDQSQEGTWDTFTRALQPSAGQLQRMMSMPAQMKSLSTPERIDRLRALRAERDAAMDQRFDATKTFYASLSPEQQRTFDQQALPGQMGSEGHGRGGHRGDRHHGGGHAGHPHGDHERHGG